MGAKIFVRSLMLPIPLGAVEEQAAVRANSRTLKNNRIRTSLIFKPYPL